MTHAQTLERGSNQALKQPQDTRLSFQDAIAKVLNESKLKQILDGGMGTEKWNDALTSDIASGTGLLIFLSIDLNRIIGVEVKIRELGTFWDIGDAARVGYESTMHRVQALYDHFAKTLKGLFERVVQAINENKLHQHNRTEKSGRGVYLVRECSVFTCTALSIEKDTAVFQFPLETLHGEKLYQITLADFRFRCPDDHPMNIPESVWDKLDVMKTTHYNYHPQILDGVLVDKSAVITSTRELVRYYSDPALCIHLGIDAPHFVVDYWDDHSERTPEPGPKVMKKTLVTGLVFGFGYFFAALLLAGVTLVDRNLLVIPTPLGHILGITCLIAFVIAIISWVVLDDQIKRRREFMSHHLVGRHTVYI